MTQQLHNHREPAEEQQNKSTPHQQSRLELRCLNFGGQLHNKATTRLNHQHF
jgi:hypothetical protein